MDDFKQRRKHIEDQVIRQSEAVLATETTQRVMRELWGNLTGKHFVDPETSDTGALEWFGIMKVAHYAAVVAICDERGIPIEVMMMTDDELMDYQIALINAATEAGKDVFIVEGDESR